MSDKERGLYIKYRLEHTEDGRPVDQHGQYFVIKFNSKDKHHKLASQAAGRAYADVIRSTNPRLAEDLYKVLGIDLQMSLEDMEELSSEYFLSTSPTMEIGEGAAVAPIENDERTGLKGAWIRGWIWFPIEDWPEQLKQKYSTTKKGKIDS